MLSRPQSIKTICICYDTTMSVMSQTVKNTSNNPASTLIIASSLGLVLWLIVAVGFDLVRQLSPLLATGVGDSSGLVVANVVVRIPLILGSFALAYGVDLRLENRGGRR